MSFYNPPKEIIAAIDSTVETVVPVIVSFNTNSGIKPLYFKYNDQTIPIWSVRSCKKEYGVYSYDCSAELSRYLTDIILTYYPDKQLWTLMV